MWYLAIDFGTTTSAAAVAESGRVRDLQVGGHPRLPSTVVLDDDGHLLAGLAAANQAVLVPDRAERTPKSHLGSPAPLLLGGTPVDVARAVAEVLRTFRDEAVRQHQGEPPTATVITHPARWSQPRLDALMRAASLAGFGRVELCPEPVAAAVHYAEDRVEPGSLVAVYDFGGGTFDTALLRRTDDGFDWVGAAGGDDGLGGEDFDHRLYELVGDALAAEEPELWTALSTSDELRWRRAGVELLAQVTRAKEALSTFPTTRIPVPNSDHDVRVTREQFEGLIVDDIRATVTEMERTVTAAGHRVDDLDLLYLAGGTSRIPLIGRLLTERFGTRVSTFADPKLVVAQGAARWLQDRYGPARSAAPEETPEQTAERRPSRRRCSAPRRCRPSAAAADPCASWHPPGPSTTWLRSHEPSAASPPAPATAGSSGAASSTPVAGRGGTTTACRGWTSDRVCLFPRRRRPPPPGPAPSSPPPTSPRRSPTESLDPRTHHHHHRRRRRRRGHRHHRRYHRRRLPSTGGTSSSPRDREPRCRRRPGHRRSPGRPNR